METHSWTMCRKSEALEHSQWGCLYQAPPLMTQESLWERKQKDGKNQRWWVIPRKQFLPDNRTATHVTSQRLLHHTRDLYRFQANGAPALRRGNRHGVLPLTKKLFEIDISWPQGKSMFYNGVSLFVLTIAQVNTKRIPYDLLLCLQAFCFTLFCLAFFLIFFGLFVMAFIFVCFSEFAFQKRVCEKVKEKEELHGQGGREIWEEGEMVKKRNRIKCLLYKNSFK